MANARSKALKKIIKESYPIERYKVDLSNDPVVLAKKERAEKLIAEYGLPEDFKKKPKADKKVSRLKRKA